GFKMEYGISPFERMRAGMNKEPEPTKPTLRGPTKDDYVGKPAFVIDSNKQKITVIWNELPEDAAWRKQAKEAGLPQTPPAPATDGVIVQFSLEQISAIQAELWSTMTYSFFPKMAIQMATFAHCDFSWSNPQ